MKIPVYLALILFLISAAMPCYAGITADTAAEFHQTGEVAVVSGDSASALNNNDISGFEEKLNSALNRFQRTAIYMLAIICIIMLINLILILQLWRRVNKRLGHIGDDHDKTNEALNLHIKDTREEVISLHEKINGKSGS